jgi:hypothetical protein
VPPSACCRAPTALPAAAPAGDELNAAEALQSLAEQLVDHSGEYSSPEACIAAAAASYSLRTAQLQQQLRLVVQDVLDQSLPSVLSAFVDALTQRLDEQRAEGAPAPAASQLVTGLQALLYDAVMARANSVLAQEPQASEGQQEGLTYMQAMGVLQQRGGGS